MYQTRQSAPPLRVAFNHLLLRSLGANTIYALFVVAVMVGHEIGLAFQMTRHH